jgi:LPS O-antigen subunit length determinant protein (WzzB/FepE family)
MSNETPAIFATLKKLPEDKKQMINNWVRETHGRPNVAIWSVKCNPDDRDELNNLLTEAIETNDWSHFTVAEAQGQAVASKPNNPETEPEEKEEPAEEKVAEEPKEEAKPESKAMDIEGLLQAEVERRLQTLREKIRDEVIEEIRKALTHEKS